MKADNVNKLLRWMNRKIIRSMMNSTAKTWTPEAKRHFQTYTQRVGVNKHESRKVMAAGK